MLMGIGWTWGVLWLERRCGVLLGGSKDNDRQMKTLVGLFMSYESQELLHEPASGHSLKRLG